MTFSSFLEEFRRQNNIQTANGLFEFLGGDKTLDMTDRHFRLICKGDQVPSVPLLQVLFDRVNGPDKKNLIISYFQSMMDAKGSAKAGGEIAEYLNQNLLSPIEKVTSSLWDNKQPYMTYSDQQLDYLNQNLTALRIQKKLLLKGELPITEFNAYQKTFTELKDLELIEHKKDKVYPSRIKYRLPIPQNSPPRMVLKGTDHIMNVMNLYLSKEGSPRQEISYGLQMVERSIAPRILEQVESFKRWVQSLAVKDTKANSVPLVFIAVTKQLEEREL